MYRFIAGRRAQLPKALYRALIAYRYEVFVRRLGWRLPECRPGVEQDQFDTEAAVYLTCRTVNGVLVGCARLLPTTRPYLLQECFPQLLGASVPPSSLRVWELSRFAAGTPGERCDRGLAPLVFGRALQVAAELGATRVVGVLSSPMERLCQRYRSDLVRMGPPTLHEGRLVVACCVKVASERSSLAGMGLSLCSRAPLGARPVRACDDTRHGFDALVPRARSDQGSARSIAQPVVDLLCQLKEDDLTLSIPR